MNPTKLPNSNSEVKVSFYKKLCRKKWFKIARPFIIITLVILIIYILTILGIFKIKNIKNTTDLNYVSNLSETTNQYLGEGYFSLNLGKLEKDVKNSNRYIKEVKAEKIFPNKIHLEIEEYDPMSYLEYKDVCYILSEEGVILEQNSEYEKCELEEGIKLNSKQNILAEDKLIFNTELLEIAKVLQEFGWEISEVVFEENLLEVSDGEKTVIIEINENYERQLAQLYLILEKVNIESIEYKSLDLRFERPVMEVL
jgi:hypothetical protein